MTDIWRGNTDNVGGKLAEYLPQVSMSEQKLSKRLREVVRFEARISDELSKNMPCGGAVRRDLLEMELAALRRDRVSIKEKLLQVLLFDPHMNFEGSEQGAGYHGRAPPEAINRPATSDSVCGRYMAYSGKDSGEGVWSRPAPFGVLNDKTMEATAEGVHGATAQAAADIKRRRLMDNATSGFNLAAPSLHWSGDKKYPINAADRDGIGNMVSWQRENSEMLCQPPRPPRTHQGTRQWIAPPLSSLNIRSPSYRTFDTLDGVSGDKAPFHVPTVLPRVSTIFSNNRHGTPTLRRGNYSPPYQSPTSEALPAYMRDRHLDEVHANDVARRGQQYSERCSVSMTSGDWQQRVGHNRFVQTGGWSEDGRPVTASGRVKRWRRRSMPVAIPIDSRQGEGATSRPYPGRNGDFPKYSAWDTGFHQQNFPHHPTGVYRGEKAECSTFLL